LIATSDASPVIVATTVEGARRHRGHMATLNELNVEVLSLPADKDGLVPLPALLDNFGRRQWTHLLIEGGETVLRSFIDQGLADELGVYVAPTQVGDVDESLPHLDVAPLPVVSSLAPDEQTIGPDRLLRYRVSE